jgi:26S proteasome regulatory subunit N8
MLSFVFATFATFIHHSSFAVPFEEDRKDPDVWYLDHNYLNTMDTMFRKVDAREYVVGFYSTGPKIR